MRKILFIFAAMLLGSIGLHASNTITYTASERLQGYSGGLDVGALTFGPVITSHTFSNGTGIITCDGEITRIGTNAFYNCSSLTSIEIPSSVTEIAYQAFIHCSSLASVMVNWTDVQSIVPIDNSVFMGNPSNRTLYVPKGTVSLYQQADIWKNFSSIRELEPGPNATITYHASAKLDGYEGSLNLGATTFGPAITKHEFSNGTGTITCNGEITKIGEYAFHNCSALTSIEIPNSVTTIGGSAFQGCSGLTSIRIPSSVTSIGNYVFSNCNGMTTVVVENGNTKYDSRDNCNAIIETSTNTLIYGFNNTIIPHTITSIGDYAFTYCFGLTSINIPNSVTTLKRYAFFKCTGLKSVTIPSSVTTIGEGVFRESSSLTSIEIPSSVTSIGDYAFGNCIGLTSVMVNWKDAQSIVPINSNVFYNIANRLGVQGATLYVPGGTTNIYKQANVWKEFGSITIHKNTITYTATEKLPGYNGSLNPDATTFGPAITSHDFSNGTGIITCNGEITKIGDNAFRDCINLSQIDIPYSVKSIGNNAFNNCTHLNPITFSNYLFSIGEGAFRGCTALTSIVIGKFVDTLGENAFRDCISLNSVTFGKYLSSIKAGTFRGCTALTSITIPPDISMIGDDVFSGCSNLTTIHIGKDVRSIEGGAFDMCKSLKTIYCYASYPPELHVNPFLDVPKTDLSVYVFSVYVSDYQNHWKDIPPSCFKPLAITIEENGIKYEPFVENARYEARVVAKEGGYTGNIAISNQITYQGMNFAVTEISPRAFGECNSMTSVTIPNSVTTIGKQAFYICSGLTSITIPQSVTTIEEQAFEGSSTGLTSIIVAGDNPKYDSRDNCNAIIEKATNTLILGCKHTKIPNNITTIGRSAFDGCYDLKDITIPNSVTTIGRSAFWECKNLTSITIPNSVTTIGINAFAGAGLTSITIPASVKEINEHAFWDCPNLEDLLFAERTEALNIGTYAFEKCPNLKYIISMVEAPPLLADGAFKGYDKDDKVIVYVPSQEAVTAYENSNWSKYFTNFFTELEYRIISSADRTAEVIKAIPVDGKVYVPAVVTLKDNLYNVAGIGDNALKDNNSLVSISLPPTMKYIGNDAFNGCTNLKNVKLPVELQTIGYYAFYGCSALDSIVIPDGVQTLDGLTFSGCSSLTYVHLPEGLRTIENECFRKCPLGQEIVVPEGVETIGVLAFEASDNVINNEVVITLPSTLKEIKTNAFFSRNKLKSVTCLATNPPTLGDGVFTHTDIAILYVPNRDVMAKYRNSQWGTYKFKFSDLMAEANKEYLRELAGSNDTAKAIANAYCDSIDNRATTTQQVQDYTNTAAMMMDKYVFPEYKVRLCDALDSIAKTVLNAQPIADDYKQRIMDTHFRGEAENLFAEGYAKIDALKQLYALKEKCKNALRDMAQGYDGAEGIAEFYAGLIDGAATQEEVYQLYEEGKKRVAKALFIGKYWKYSDGCYYLGGFIEEK